MSYFTGTIAHGTTGVKTIAVGFQPLAARITVGAKSGSSAVNQRSEGNTDGTQQFFLSNYSDSTSDQSKEGSDRLVSQYERVSGTLTEKVRVNLDSFTATQLKYNVVTADANYTLHIEVWG